MAKPEVTVTRKDLDTFVYNHPADNSPVELSLSQVMKAGSSVAADIEDTYSALCFLTKALEAMADTGNHMDEPEMRGIAVICSALGSGLVGAANDNAAEMALINHLAETGIPGLER